MTSLFPSDVSQYLSILLVFFRTLGFLMVFPITHHNVIPRHFNLLLGLTLALVLFPLVKQHYSPVVLDIGLLFRLVLRETFLGFFSLFIVYLTFEGLSLGFQMVSTQMGLNSQGVLDPTRPGQSSLIPLQHMLFLVVFLLLDLHHQTLQLFLKTFEFPIVIQFNQTTLSAFTQTTFDIFVLALKVSAPFQVILFLMHLGFGILGRFIPQMNLILFNFPVSFLLGLFLLFVLMPEVLNFFEISIEQVFDKTLLWFKII